MPRCKRICRRAVRAASEPFACFAAYRPRRAARVSTSRLSGRCGMPGRCFHCTVPKKRVSRDWSPASSTTVRSRRCRQGCGQRGRRTPPGASFTGPGWRLLPGRPGGGAARSGRVSLVGQSRRATTPTPSRPTFPSGCSNAAALSPALSAIPSANSSLNAHLRNLLLRVPLPDLGKRLEVSLGQPRGRSLRPPPVLTHPLRGAHVAASPTVYNFVKIRLRLG